MSRAIDRALTDFVDRLNAGEAPEVAAFLARITEALEGLPGGD